MKTKSKAVEELDELIEQLAQIEDITSEINKLKINITKEIENITENASKRKEEEIREETRNKLNIIKNQEGGYNKERKRRVNKVGNQRNRIQFEEKINKIREEIEEIQHRTPIPTKQQNRKTTEAKIYLSERTTSKFKKGDTVKIVNHHIGNIGDLFGKIGTVHTVGKAFIFISIPNIPLIQQRAESNLELVKHYSKNS